MTEARSVSEGFLGVIVLDTRFPRPPGDIGSPETWTRAGIPARFVTVAFVAWPDGPELWCEGVVEGVIATERRGSTGWGYDPVFQPLEGGGRTFAEMGADAKNAMSHRARAFRALAAALRER